MPGQRSWRTVYPNLLCLEYDNAKFEHENRRFRQWKIRNRMGAGAVLRSFTELLNNEPMKEEQTDICGETDPESGSARMKPLKLSIIRIIHMRTETVIDFTA